MYTRTQTQTFISNHTQISSATQQQQNDIPKACDQKLNSIDDEPLLEMSLISHILTECFVGFAHSPIQSNEQLKIQ